MADLLTRGAIADILNGGKPANPVLQVLGTKIIEGNTNTRIRMQVSDGQQSLATVMLATQLNHLALNDGIDKYCVIKLNDYQTSTLQKNRRIVICLDIDILKKGNEVGQTIGAPKSSSNSDKETAKPSVSTINGSGNIIAQNGDGKPKSSYDSPKPSGKMTFSNSGTPQTPGGTPMRVMPIVSLTPYQNKWTIRARVTQKGAIKEWKNARGEGKLFSFTVLDESGDIRITCFKEEVDKFFDIVEPGKAYYISNAQLKPANRQYNTTTHDYEMTLRRESILNPCDESEVVELPKVCYNFVPIPKVTDHVSQIVDVIGVLKSAEDIQTVNIKSQNRETLLRNLNIVDKSGSEIRLTVWGNEAEKFDCDGAPVVALKSVRVTDFGGCSLSTVSSSMLIRNPDIPEAYELKQWYESGGCNQVTQVITSASGGGQMPANWKTLTAIKDENMGMGDKPDYITCKCTVLLCKSENILYKACSTEKCNKKVIDLQNGSYRCEKCDKTTSEFKYRMILNMNVGDETDSVWVTCFQEQGEMVLGMSADDLGALREENEAKFDEVMKSPNFSSYFFKLRIKMERYNDEERRRCTVVNVSPVAHEDYARKLIADIEKLATL